MRSYPPTIQQTCLAFLLDLNQNLSKHQAVLIHFSCPSRCTEQSPPTSCTCTSMVQPQSTGLQLATLCLTPKAPLPVTGCSLKEPVASCQVPVIFLQDFSPCCHADVLQKHRTAMQGSVPSTQPCLHPPQHPQSSRGANSWAQQAGLSHSSEHCQSLL